MTTRKITASDDLGDTAPIESLSDDTFQDHLLQGVSRTFALTIPELPHALARVVSNAYLLCRIVDTIEDEAHLSAGQKRHFCDQFTKVVAGEASATHFADDLYPLLSEDTLPAERELIGVTPRVITITRGFNANQREALESCVRIMSEGMADFQDHNDLRGLADLTEMDRYCYHVAGVVGEMLTKLFCDYSPQIGAKRRELLGLAVSFGQGLQMTNILKDQWDDRRRGACWLPREVFAETGVDLGDLTPGSYDERFGEGLTYLIAVAHGHLHNALRYTLLIPSRETGIRNFCLWALGMAMLTLRKINRHKDFSAGQQVKISRNSVKTTVLVTRLTVRNDAMLRRLFQLAGRGLPLVQV